MENKRNEDLELENLINLLEEKIENYKPITIEQENSETDFQEKLNEIKAFLGKFGKMGNFEKIVKEKIEKNKVDEIIQNFLSKKKSENKNKIFVDKKLIGFVNLPKEDYLWPKEKVELLIKSIKLVKKK